jgi:hypothetical protein
MTSHAGPPALRWGGNTRVRNALTSLPKAVHDSHSAGKSTSGAWLQKREHDRWMTGLANQCGCLLWLYLRSNPVQSPSSIVNRRACIPRRGARLCTGVGLTHTSECLSTGQFFLPRWRGAWQSSLLGHHSLLSRSPGHCLPPPTPQVPVTDGSGCAHWHRLVAQITAKNVEVPCVVVL